MQIYFFATGLGFLGLLSMALLGHGIGHVGHGHGLGSGAHGSVSGGGPPAAAHGADLLLWLSPRALFSLLLGTGLSGWVLSDLLAHWSGLPWSGPLGLLARGMVFCLALLGGYLFERFLMQPYWKMLLLFESRPMRPLASQTWHRAEAVTDFDARGAGLVRFEYEGEVRQMLAILSPEERAAGVAVRQGDQVRLEEILEDQNRCVVSAALIINRPV